MTDTLSACRRDFEAWYKTTSKTRAQYDFKTTLSGSYVMPQINIAWQAWKECWILCDARVKGAMA